MKMFRRDEGFTLVELMVVVLIIGILVAIAVPVFLNASASAAAKSCQANQRIIIGAVSTYRATVGDSANKTAGIFAAATTGGWGPLLIPSYVKTEPKCPSVTTSNEYYVNAAGDVTGDQSAATWYNITHNLP
jgi:prepilin-type N-terminal cleavage/methylation domain-containing protein